MGRPGSARQHGSELVAERLQLLGWAVAPALGDQGSRALERRGVRPRRSPRTTTPQHADGGRCFSLGRAVTACSVSTSACRH